jgi:hypothetical protein
MRAGILGLATGAVVLIAGGCSAAVPTAEPAARSTVVASPFTDPMSPSVDAQQNCHFAAHDVTEHYSTAVEVAGALETDIAGLRRAAARAITFKSGVDNADHWPGVDATFEATLCFLDGDFEEVPGYAGPVERLVVGYRQHSWDVLDFGPKERIPIVAP